MPPEPKKPIEELLEASARARRAEFGGDPKMPNPMRARLQDEVARLARDREPKAHSPWFVLSWPRLAMGAAFASVIVAASVFWWQTHQASESGARVAMDQKASAPEISRAETANYPAGATAQQAPAERDKLETRESGAKDETKAQQLAKAALASQPALQNFHQSAADSASAGVGANFKQQFSQSATNKMTARAAQGRQMPKLLDNFQVEQNGRDFRVVDDDGSTYAGRIEQLTPNDTRNVLKEKQSYTSRAAAPATAKRGSPAEEAPNNEFYFRASGYNSSLKKSVVFEGNYIVAPPLARKDLDSAAQKDNVQTSARIIGTAKVPGEPPVQIEAVTVPSK